MSEVDRSRQPTREHRAIAKIPISVRVSTTCSMTQDRTLVGAQERAGVQPALSEQLQGLIPSFETHCVPAPCTGGKNPEGERLANRLSVDGGQITGHGP